MKESFLLIGRDLYLVVDCTLDIPAVMIAIVIASHINYSIEKGVALGFRVIVNSS